MSKEIIMRVRTGGCWQDDLGVAVAISMMLAILVVSCEAAGPAASLDPQTAERLNQLGGGAPNTIYPRLHPEAAFKEYEEQVTVVMPSRSKVHVLNETGSKIFTLLDGHHSISDIAHALVQEFDVDYATALRDTVEFLVELKEEGMLAEARQGPTDKKSGEQVDRLNDLAWRLVI